MGRWLAGLKILISEFEMESPLKKVGMKILKLQVGMKIFR